MNNFNVHTNKMISALQNIQARSRMVAAYEFAQLLPTVRFGEGAGGLLVLGSANVDGAFLSPKSSFSVQIAII